MFAGKIFISRKPFAPKHIYVSVLAHIPALLVSPISFCSIFSSVEKFSCPTTAHVCLLLHLLLFNSFLFFFTDILSNHSLGALHTITRCVHKTKFIFFSRIWHEAMTTTLRFSIVSIELSLLKKIKKMK